MNMIRERVSRERTVSGLGSPCPPKLGMTIIENGNVPALVEYEPTSKRNKVMQISFPMRIKDSPNGILWKIYQKRDIIFSLTDERPKPVGRMVHRKDFY